MHDNGVHAKTVSWSSNKANMNSHSILKFSGGWSRDTWWILSLQSQKVKGQGQQRTLTYDCFLELWKFVDFKVLVNMHILEMLQTCNTIDSLNGSHYRVGCKNYSILDNFGQQVATMSTQLRDTSVNQQTQRAHVYHTNASQWLVMTSHVTARTSSVTFMELDTGRFSCAVADVPNLSVPSSITEEPKFYIGDLLLLGIVWYTRV